MKLVYNGPHPEVVVDEYGEDVIVNGQPVDLPDDLAARLLEQSTWEAADKDAKKTQKEIDQAVADQAPIVPADPGPATTEGTS